MTMQELWAKATQFHGHECPGLATGVRASMAAMEKMQIDPAKDEEIVCVAENDACGVDGIQAILGCTLGKGNLLFRDRGKSAYSFFSRANGQKLRITTIPSNRDFTREQRIAFILQAPLHEVFSFGEPTYDLPQEARLFATIPCQLCGEGASENKMRLQEGKKVCLDCFIKYDRGR